MRYAMLGLLCVVGCGGGQPNDGGKLDVWGLPAAKRAGPAADKEGAEWTHRELLAHLKARGIGFTVIDVWGGADPAVTIVDREGYVPLMVRAGAEGKMPGDYPPEEPINAANIRLCPSAQAARESTGVLGNFGFAWGRFAFFAKGAGGPAFLANIRGAIE
ncbi:MAG: hypothetical protein IT429_13420 [Gemmataceae bacterium]|nr:hypothetical protein [Gemmataceae bacterium]